MTLYPTDIDGYNQIRVLRDRIDEIIAKDHNDLRSAVIAIEQELGKKPSGVYGTVSNRLDVAASNIESHVLGSIPRHLDTTIESNSKSGSPYYNLSGTTVAQQIQELLNYVNKPKYSGSNPYTFADGYTLPSSFLESAVTGIVRYLGQNATGSNAIGFNGTTNALADGSTLSTGSVKDGIEDFVDKIGGNSGSSRIGATSFSTGSFSISGADVDAQLQSLGDVSEELSSMLSNSLGSFVISGMSVTRNNSTSVNVAAGTISVDGRSIAYAGGTVSHSGIGNLRIQAIINSGSVVVLEAMTDALLMAESSVPLAVFTETGAAHINFYDLRRFGKFVNREFLTVGSSDKADFTSFKSALEWIRRNISGGISSPKHIKVVSDITIPAGEVPYSLPTGCSIDGGNHTISWSNDEPIFLARNVDNILIKNVKAYYTTGVLGTSAALINLELTASSINNRKNFKIIDCHTSSSAGDNIPYFIKYDTNSLGNLTFEDVHIQNCTAECVISALPYNPPDRPIINSVISNNHFYQITFATQPDYCITVGSFCKVSSNIISGGYSFGISTESAETSTIESNIINGGTGDNILGTGSAIMQVGISIESSDNIIVSNNQIKGIKNYGIDCNTSNNCVISENFINNVQEPTSSMIGISGNGDDSLILNNYILYPGTTGINEGRYIANNIIIGDPTITTSFYAIYLNTGSNKFVSNNYIKDLKCITVIKCNGVTDSIISNNISNVEKVGIDVGGGNRNVISNNILTGISSSVLNENLIKNVGSNCIVCDNFLYNSNYYAINLNHSNCLVHGNYIRSSNNSSIVINGSNHLILSNFINSSGSNGIENTGSSNFISNNYIWNSTNGIYAYGISNKINISNNKILTSSADGINLYLTSGDEHYIFGNYISGYIDSGISIGNLGGSRSLISSNSLISNGTANNGIFIGSTTDEISIMNNMIIENDVGIYFNATSNHSFISGNRLIDISASGIFIDGFDCHVASNYITLLENALSGIYLSPSSWETLIVGNRIDGNYVTTSYSYGITTNGSDNISITGNYVNSCWLSAFNLLGSSALVVGNFADARTGNDAYLMDPFPATAITASGNIARGGNTPINFSAGHNIDGDSCRRIA